MIRRLLFLTCMIFGHVYDGEWCDECNDVCMANAKCRKCGAAMLFPEEFPDE